MTDERLLAPCTRALLEGWTGPVHITQIRPAPAVCIGEFRADGLVHLWAETGDAVVRPESLSLDLSRTECRDRVARVLAGLLLRGIPPNGDGFSWRADFGGWQLRSHNANWWAGFGADTSRWFGADEGNRTGRHPSRSVPTLRTLDPHDDTRLPDGSRLVEALALAAVWREVSRGQ